jgi:phage host-nuclease inhibitor protein Gam
VREAVMDLLWNPGGNTVTKQSTTIATGIDIQLQAIAFFGEEIAKKEAVVTLKIKKLRQQLEKDTAKARTGLAKAEDILQGLTLAYDFPKGSRTLECPAGKVYVKKQPDSLSFIKDEQYTIDKLKELDMESYIRVKEEVIKNTLKNIASSVQKRVGVTVIEGQDKAYYELYTQTSTGRA